MTHRRAERQTSAFVLTLLLAWPAVVAALSSDREQPIHIEANRVELDERARTSTYTGSVQLRQGSLRLEADRLVVHRGEQSVQRMVAQGQPATFRQRADDSDTLIRAQADTMLYRADAGTFELTGDAHLWQGRDQFSGARIVYELERERVRAEGGADDGRVRVIIHPEQEGAEE